MMARPSSSRSRAARRSASANDNAGGETVVTAKILSVLACRHALRPLSHSLHAHTDIDRPTRSVLPYRIVACWRYFQRLCTHARLLRTHRGADRANVRVLATHEDMLFARGHIVRAPF